MGRFWWILLAFVVACGGVAVEPSDTSVIGPTTSTEDPVDTTLGSSSTSPPQSATSPDRTTTTESDLPVAPDFTLELGSGGEYQLSATDKPVYLVFWAEW